MIVRGVNVFPTQIEELLLKRPVLTSHYQIVLTKEGPLDVLTLNVEPCPESAPDAVTLDSARTALAYDIKALIGVSAEVNVLAVNGIERSVGKAWRVVDKRNAPALKGITNSAAAATSGRPASCGRRDRPRRRRGPRNSRRARCP